MNEFLATLILASLFALRFIVPLCIMLGFGYLLNRMQARWQINEYMECENG